MLVQVCLAVTDGIDEKELRTLLAESDVAIVLIGTFSGEGRDRYNLTFHAGAPGPNRWVDAQKFKLLVI